MLSQLKLRDFRCFESLEVELAPGPQFFTGDNAQGKTSILEAACVLLRLASPRSTQLTPLVRAGSRGFSVQGRHGTRQMQFYFGPERRKLALDGVEQPGTAEYLRVARSGLFRQHRPRTGHGSGGWAAPVPGFSGHADRTALPDESPRVRAGVAVAEPIAQSDAGAAAGGRGVRYASDRSGYLAHPPAAQPRGRTGPLGRPRPAKHRRLPRPRRRSFSVWNTNRAAARILPRPSRRRAIRKRGSGKPWSARTAMTSS